MNNSTEKKKMSDHDRLMRLVTSAVMIALAFVLSFFKFSEFPYGGSVTCFSMVPIVLLGIMYGKGWGLACGTINGVLQALQGAFGSSKAFAGLGTFEVILMCFLDYIAAFAVIGLAGMLVSKAIKSNNAKKNRNYGQCRGVNCFFPEIRYSHHFRCNSLRWIRRVVFLRRFCKQHG